ncbi:MAG: SDR family oxidoreductase [Acidimicrobiia bacterium]|nr:SDR family oxidoreductase [Acidimicrobiia bacterium]
MRVQGKVVVVTGGASGIGKALCERFAAEGAEAVVVVDRNGPGAEAVAAAIGGHAETCDLGDQAQVTDLVARVEARFGRIDVLCNNAGIANDQDFLEGDVDPWEQQWAVNVMAHVHAVRAALPAMLDRGEGYLFHTASMAGILTTHGAAAYAATKHAVVGLAEWLALTYGHRGIKVWLLAPLGVDTPMLDKSSEWAAQAAGPVKSPAQVAQQVVDAFDAERFLIYTDPIAAQWVERKNSDLDRWLGGMNRLQQRIEAAG